MSDININNFILQIIPIVMLYLLFPIILLAIYFGIRQYRKSRQTPADSETAHNAPATTDALSRIRQVSASDHNPADLPDLDLLMSELATSVEPQPIARPLANNDDVTLHTGQTIQADEVLVIKRDKSDGRLLVQIDDTGYRSLRDIPEKRREFTKIMKELGTSILKPDDSPVLDDVPQSAQTQSVAQSPEPAETASPEQTTPPAVPDTTPDTTEEKSSAVPPPAAPAIEGPVPGDLPSYKFDDNPAQIEQRRFRAPKVEFEAPPELNIADAIEAYLQFRIQHTPEYRGRNIHIRPSSDGGVRIQIDNTFYDFVDEVENEQDRAFLQQTISEWQERQ